MAGSKSDWLENVVLDSILGKSTTSLSTGTGAGIPGTVYIALYNTTVNDTVTALTDECTGSGGGGAGTTYARQAVTNSSANWTNSTAGSKQNKTAIVFSTNAGADWGTIKSFAILNSNSTTTGDALYWGDLTASQAISSGNVVRFSTGAIVITES